MIKIRQAIDLKPGDAKQRNSNKYEIQKYLNDVYQSQIDESMADVYVTDHKVKTEQLLTFSEEEDEQFYKYHQSLNAYKTKASITIKPTIKYDKGSLSQRLFDPLAGSTRNANGTIVYEVAEKELAHGMDEQRIRA